MSKNDEPINGEIVDEEINEKSFKAEILAQINQYSERPDLFLEVLEKYEPGVIKSIVKEIKTEESRNSEARHKFGKTQAYTGLIVHSIAAIVIIFSLLYLIHTKQIGFWVILGLAIFYAICQGGVEGFMRIIKAVASLIKKGKSE